MARHRQGHEELAFSFILLKKIYPLEIFSRGKNLNIDFLSVAIINLRFSNLCMTMKPSSV